MRSRLNAVAGGMVIVGCATLSAASTGREAAPLTVSARLLRENDRPFLEFTLTSHQDTNLLLAAELVPWRNAAYSLVMLVDPTHGGRALNDSHAVLPGILGETTTLGPRAKLVGRIDLYKRFPELKDRLEATEILVIWSFRPALPEYPATPRVSGLLVLEKQSPTPGAIRTASPSP